MLPVATEGFVRSTESLEKETDPEARSRFEYKIHSTCDKQITLMRDQILPLTDDSELKIIYLGL